MRIAIIGAGFTGLSSAYELTKQGHDVVVFEKDSLPGGLAIGYKEKDWEWALEKHYHHWFTNDKSILGLARQINYEVIIKRPKTAVFINNKSYQLDSPFTVLRFPLLSFIDKLRMGTVLGILKLYPFWQKLEKYKISVALPNLMGEKPYKMIWEPLIINKFGFFANDISLAWFWARIKKRTPSLAYPKGGFLSFANELVLQIKKKGGKFLFNTEIVELGEDDKIYIKSKDIRGKIRSETFDKAIITIPSFLFLKISPHLPEEYKKKVGILKGLGAINLVLRLNKQFLNDGTYWLNICDKKTPVMAIVEHTNFIDKKHYNNEHIVYLGNYKPQQDNYFKMTAEEMLEKFDPYLKRINKSYRSNIIGSQLFKVPFAQPIIPVNYSKILPSFKTPFKNVFLANIEQVYPWDRGTNYAVELGQKIAKFIK